MIGLYLYWSCRILRICGKSGLDQTELRAYAFSTETEIDMIIVTLGVLATIAYLAWNMPAQGEMRRVPVRIRKDDPRRPKR